MGWNSIKWNKIEDPGGIGLCRTSKDQKWIEFLLYIEWINKVPLYSTGTYIEYSVMKQNGKEHVKECLMESFCCTVEMNTTL